MSNPCMEFFEANAENRQKVKALIANGSGNQWLAEQHSASKFSPGAISKEERIVRQVHSPTHWDGEAKAVKLGFYDDLTSKGLSVNRLLHANKDDLSDESEKRAALTPGREAIGFVSACAEEFSALLTVEGEVRGGIFDTALEKDVSHADVCATVAGSDEERRKLRYRLYNGLKEKFSPGRL